MWWEVILDALKDTAILCPFLFVMYVLIELLEHKTGVGKPNRALSGKCAPLLGVALGTLPMCGFSVMASKLYRHRHITLGTLLAVFVATSDEALLVLVTTPALHPVNKVISVLCLIGVKAVLAIAVGYLADLFFRKHASVQPLPAPCEHGQIPEEHEHHEHDGRDEHGEHEHHEHHEHGHYTACEHKKHGKLQMYFVSPLLHMLEVAAFVLLVNLAFGYLFFFLGEEQVVSFLQAGQWVQPLVCCVVGLIPNCASSVILAETYAMGGITFGSMTAGLIVNVGLGFIALLRGKERIKQALLIMAFLFVLGIAVGYAINAIGLFLPAVY